MRLLRKFRSAVVVASLVVLSMVTTTNIAGAAAPAPTTTYSEIIFGNQAWWDSGLILRSKTFDVTAGGVVKFTASDPGKTPDGDPSCIAPKGWTAPKLDCWSLVARIDSGAPFQLGSAGSFKVKKAGRLFFGVNDQTGAFGDNVGSWIITVTCVC
jgi:hypothetical protein